MPTYTVTSPTGCLDAEKRAMIAAEITRVHNAATGAPTYFAQVIFNDVQPGHYFVGGVPLRGKQLFVNGQIRAGRTCESKDALISQMLAAVAAASQLPRNNIWIIFQISFRGRWSSSAMSCQKPATRRNGRRRCPTQTGRICRPRDEVYVRRNSLVSSMRRCVAGSCCNGI